MADAYRYPLTRICLRTGSLTLPLNLLGVFPDRGDIVAVDPERDAEFVLHVEGRRVLGLAPFFATRDLTANDELTIRPLEDGRFAFAAVVRPRRPDFGRPEVVGRWLDALVDAGVPMSEAEIRALHPELPSGFPLHQALEQEPRLVLHEGRWRRRLPEADTAETAADRERAARRAERAPMSEVRSRRGEERRSPSTGSAAAAAAAADAAAAAAAADAAAAAAAAARAEVDSAARAGAEALARAEADAAARAEADLAVRREREAADRAAREAAARTDREEAARARAEVGAALEAQAAREAEIMALVEAEELARVVGSVSEAVGLDAVEGARRLTRERLAAHAEDDALASARVQRDDRAARKRGDAGSEEGRESFGWDQPLGRRLRFPWSRRREEPKPTAAPESAPSGDPLKLDRLGEPRPVDRSAAPASVSAAPRATLFPSDVGLNSASLPPGDPAKTKRAREAFATLGYRVEGLAHGQLMLHADFGRHLDRVLVHVLPDGQRLDWAALLARRREAGASHLAVVGDHRDLHRQVAPADLAKATLWSWAGLERVLQLASAMPIGPFDLSPHFERDGLFEYGLDRFERTVAKRVQERGAFSAVLECLALFKAPAVFLLEDVASTADLPREQALRVLERLAEAPWHLVSRVDSGEFCLRHRAHDALDQMAAYAASLRARLPERQRDRVRGLPDDLDPIAAADVPAAQGGVDGRAPAVGAAQPGGAPDGGRRPATSEAGRVPAAASQSTEGRATPPAVGEDAARPFAGPGLGPSDPTDADDVDLSLVAVKRPKRRR